MKQNLKYVIILAICFVIILLSVRMFLKPPQPSHPQEEEQVTRDSVYFDAGAYYDKEMPAVELNLGERKIVFPNHKNILLLGINREVNATIRFYDELFEQLDPDRYDIEVIILTRQPGFTPSRFVKTYRYDNAGFDSFFKIKEDGKFVLLVDKTNRIKHFLDKMTEPYNIKLLMDRFYGNVTSAKKKE
jgi:hypothetical protein